MEWMPLHYNTSLCALPSIQSVTYTCTHAYTNTHTHTHTHARTHAHMHTHTNTQAALWGSLTVLFVSTCPTFLAWNTESTASTLTPWEGQGRGKGEGGGQEWQNHTCHVYTRQWKGSAWVACEAHARPLTHTTNTYTNKILPFSHVASVWLCVCSLFHSVAWQTRQWPSRCSRPQTPPTSGPSPPWAHQHGRASASECVCMCVCVCACACCVCACVVCVCVYEGKGINVVSNQLLLITQYAVSAPCGPVWCTYASLPLYL